MTGVELELITDIDAHLFIKKDPFIQNLPWQVLDRRVLRHGGFTNLSWLMLRNMRFDHWWPPFRCGVTFGEEDKSSTLYHYALTFIYVNFHPKTIESTTHAIITPGRWRHMWEFRAFDRINTFIEKKKKPQGYSFRITTWFGDIRHLIFDNYNDY